MKFYPTPISDLFVAELTPIKDERGFFTRAYCEKELLSAGIQKPITQINHSRTTSVGAIRGMHFQYPPHAEVKMVRCLSGQVFDVAIDIRRGSKTFLHWYGEYLSADNFKMMVIPEGFAHGFQVLSPNSELLYYHTASYCPEAESGILYDDTLVGVEWPIEPTELSERDRNHKKIDEGFVGIAL